MKRILIINNAAIGGGVESVMNNLIKYLVDKEEKVTVFTTFNEYDFYEKYPKEVKYIHLSVPNASRFPKEHSRFKHAGLRTRVENKIAMFFLKQKKYDVVIAIKEGTSMQLASKLKADKKIGWVHVDYRYMYWTKSVFGSGQAECKCMRDYFNKIVCVSEAAADSVRETIGDPGNLCVKYNPIAYEDIKKKALEECQYAKPDGKMLFVASGRLTEQKNFLMLVDVCIELSSKYEFELWIIGNGPQCAEIETMIQESNTNCVRLLGFQDNPYPFIKMADCFISAAVWESYGLAIQESLILETPVLTTECPAIKEIFDERFGKMIPTNRDALKSAILDVLENPQTILKYQEEIHRNYSMEELWEKRLEDICSLWENINDEE